MSERPLAGLKVLELARVLAGPWIDGQFARLSESLGLGLNDHDRFATNRGRVANRAALVAVMGPAIAARPRAEVLAAMAAAGVPAGPINTVAEAFAEPQAIARGIVRTTGSTRAPRPPMRFSDADLAADRGAPRLDEHGDAIRAAMARGPDWPGS